MGHMRILSLTEVASQCFRFDRVGTSALQSPSSDGNPTKRAVTCTTALTFMRRDSIKVGSYTYLHVRRTSLLSFKLQVLVIRPGAIAPGLRVLYSVFEDHPLGSFIS
jgi:hypothetical protein